MIRIITTDNQTVYLNPFHIVAVEDHDTHEEASDTYTVRTLSTEDYEVHRPSLDAFLKQVEASRS